MDRFTLRFFTALAFVVSMAFPVWGQKSGPGQPPSQPPSQPRSQPVNPGVYPPSATTSGTQMPSRTPPFIYGSILTGNGVPLPNTASVELRCGIQFVRAVHPDSHGHFEFNLQGGPLSANEDMSAAINPAVQQSANPNLMVSQAAGTGSNYNGATLDDCELRVSAPGYRPLSKIVMLNRPEVTGLNTGTLVLMPLVNTPDATVSVSTLLAPANARKEFKKGQSDIRHNKLASAARHLQKAVAEYDNFAEAWDALGTVYFTQHKNEEAGRAFSKAIDADPKFAPTYVNLAQLQLQKGQFEDAAGSAGKALELIPGSVPASFIQAVADFKLNHLDAAEKSARVAERGPHQNIPQVPLLLADILLAKHDYAGAVAEMQSYLKDYPKGRFAPKVRSRLPEVQKLADETK